MKTDLFLKCKVYKYLNNYVTLKTISTIKIRSMVWWLYWLQSIRYKSVTWYYPFTAVADFLLYFCIWIALYSKIVQHGRVVCTCLRTWLVCVLQTQVICVRLPTWLLCVLQTQVICVRLPTWLLCVLQTQVICVHLPT